MGLSNFRLVSTGVTGQNIPRPKYTRVYYSLDQFIPRGIFWPRPIHTPSGYNILVPGQFGAGQFGADNSARQFVPDNSAQNYKFYRKSRFHSAIFFSSIPLPCRQYFSSILIPNSYCLDRNRPIINRIYNPI